MDGKQLFGHCRPGRRLGRRGPRGQRLDEIQPVGRSVGVEVVQHDEASSGGLDAGEHASLQRRELLGPSAVAAGVEAEVDHIRSRRDPRREGLVGGVTDDQLGARDVAASTTVHGHDVVAAVDELLDDQPADLAGAEDDMAVHGALHSVRFRTNGSTTVKAVTTTAPAAPNTVNCSSTRTPTEVVIAQPAAHMAPSANGHAAARLPTERRRSAAWPAPTASPQNAP